MISSFCTGIFDINSNYYLIIMVSISILFVLVLLRDPYFISSRLRLINSYIHSQWWPSIDTEEDLAPRDGHALGHELNRIRPTINSSGGQNLCQQVPKSIQINWIKSMLTNFTHNLIGHKNLTRAMMRTVRFRRPTDWMSLCVRVMFLCVNGIFYSCLNSLELKDGA